MGKGLQMYTSMPDTDVDDYGRLKVALLKQYRLTKKDLEENSESRGQMWEKQCSNLLPELEDTLKDGLN